MIDVVFNLIFFFLLASQFAQANRSELELPRQPGERDDPDEKTELVINIDEAGEILIQGNATTLDKLETIVQQTVIRLGGDPALIPVTIRIDKRTPSRDLDRATRLLRKHKIGHVRLAVEKPRGGGG